MYPCFEEWGNADFGWLEECLGMSFEETFFTSESGADSAETAIVFTAVVIGIVVSIGIVASVGIVVSVAAAVIVVFAVVVSFSVTTDPASLVVVLSVMQLIKKLFFVKIIKN